MKPRMAIKVSHYREDGSVAEIQVLSRIDTLTSWIIQKWRNLQQFKGMLKSKSILLGGRFIFNLRARAAALPAALVECLRLRYNCNHK